jgi:hypothetical protein
MDVPIAEMQRRTGEAGAEALPASLGFGLVDGAPEAQRILLQAALLAQLGEEGLERRAAADKAVRSMLGSGPAIDQRRGSEFLKALQPFVGFFNAQASVTMKRHFLGKRQGNYSSFLRSVLYRVFLSAAIGALLKSLWKKDDGELWKLFLKEALDNGVGGFFLMRDFVNVAAMALSGGQGGAAPASLYLLSLARASAFGKMAKRTFEGKADWTDAGREAARTLALLPFGANPLRGTPDAAGDAFWNSLRWWESDFDQDMWDFVVDTVFGWKLKK